MTATSPHADLIERLERAEGPDRELDLAIGALWPESRPFTLSVEQQRGRKPPVLSFTASVDAAVALVERVLPGAVWSVDRHGGKWRPGYWSSARVAMPFSGAGDDENGEPSAKSDAAYPALALCIALLRALSAQSLSSQEPTR